jgi:PQQ-dependent dehydrogenase (methanol/ethanol family)
MTGHWRTNMQARIVSVFTGLAIMVSTAAVSMGAASDGAGTEWTHLGGTAQSLQYSPLRQINASNMGSVGLLRHTDLPVKEGLVANPLIKDGVAYVSAPRGIAIAVDLSSGKVLWTFEPALDYSRSSIQAIWTSHVNRGLGMDEQNVYTTAGCYLFAVDRKTGAQVWQSFVCDPTHYLGTNAAPRVGGGKVFVGVQNIERGTERGYAAAFDARNGRELWRFYTVPGDPTKPFENPQMELASKTWGPDYWKITKGGGGAAGVWDGLIYDPQTDLLIFGSGNPGPHSSPENFAWLGSHELLYSDSIIAVSASTGKYVWHYQLLGGDAWGISDATAHMILTDLALPGGTRHVLLSAEKQFVYMLDAKTGEFISGGAYVTQANFLMDPKTGKLTVREELKTWKHPGTTAVIQPGAWGGHSWILSAYSPDTRLLYIPAFIIPQEFGWKGESAYDYGLTPGAKYKARGQLIAWDPIAQKERWHVDLSTIMNGGALATAGNVVFQGTAEGGFHGYDAHTGQRLWSYDTHSIIEAGPSTAMVNGTQLIVVPAGDASASNSERYFSSAATTPQTLMAPSRLLIFGLGGKEVLPPSPLKVIPKPPRAKPAEALAKAGLDLFYHNSCTSCHGEDLRIPGQGRIPDLRLLTEGELQAMPSILREGTLLPLGMPKFPNLSDADINALQAFIESRAWEDYEEQQGGPKAPSVHPSEH